MPTHFRAIAASRVVWSMLLAEPGAEFANFRTERADANGKGRVSAHPLSRQETDVRTIATESDTADHEVICFFMGHADHFIRAGIAKVRTVHARLDTVDGVLLL